MVPCETAMRLKPAAFKQYREETSKGDGSPEGRESAGTIREDHLTPGPEWMPLKKTE